MILYFASGVFKGACKTLVDVAIQVSVKNQEQILNPLTPALVSAFKYTTFADAVKRGGLVLSARDTKKSSDGLTGDIQEAGPDLSDTKDGFDDGVHDTGIAAAAPEVLAQVVADSHVVSLT